jgi:uncharacterized protein YjbJ (UPF0337 family)
MEGTFMANIDEIKGKINQASGELTDDQVQKLKGHVQESIGKGKSSGEDMIQKLSREVNEMIDDFKRKNK